MTSRVALVTYESPWFPAGGIAAVMGRLPNALALAAAVPTIVLTPFHRQSPKLCGLSRERVGTCIIRHSGNDVRIGASTFDDSQGCTWCFIEPENGKAPITPPVFDGKRHPYDMPPAQLLRDALVFGVAVARTLETIDADAKWTVFLQDWETATAALAIATRLTHNELHLTLHNTYDAAATDEDLSAVEIDAALCPGTTVLERAIPLVRKPLMTVSDQFAIDMATDILQTTVIAPHLQSQFASAVVVGIDNGPFADVALPIDIFTAAAASDYEPLRNWKTDRKAKAVQALREHVSTEDQPLWGDQRRFRDDDSPWLVMAGRDDPRQKGYDVAASAIETYLKRNHGSPNCAQFLLFPVPGDEGLTGLDFLRSLAQRFSEDVVAFPFIWRAGFGAALQAAAYGMMPSLYEPFGMANEFYLQGACIGIARGTGGNLQQIVPLRATAAFSLALQARAQRYHPISARPTGILFRELDQTDASIDWEQINAAAYRASGRGRLEQRETIPVFRAMANEMRIAIEEAVRIYREDPHLYYDMLTEGISHIQRTFSWRRAAQEYARLLS